MNQMPNNPDSPSLNEFERQNLEAKTRLLRRSLERFPKVTSEQMQLPANLVKAENWAKSTTIYLFNIFKALVAIPFRTLALKQAIQHTRQSFHAVFELVFCTIREPRTEDLHRARLAVETVVGSCGRLV